MITLVLTMDTRMIGAIPVDKKSFKNREYLGEKIRELRQKCKAQLSAPHKPPVIYLEGVPSKMNSSPKSSLPLHML